MAEERINFKTIPGVGYVDAKLVEIQQKEYVLDALKYLPLFMQDTAVMNDAAKILNSILKNPEQIELEYNEGKAKKIADGWENNFPDLNWEPINIIQSAYYDAINKNSRYSELTYEAKVEWIKEKGFGYLLDLLFHMYDKQYEHDVERKITDLTYDDYVKEKSEDSLSKLTMLFNILYMLKGKTLGLELALNLCGLNNFLFLTWDVVAKYQGDIFIYQQDNKYYAEYRHKTDMSDQSYAVLGTEKLNYIPGQNELCYLALPINQKTLDGQMIVDKGDVWNVTYDESVPGLGSSLFIFNGVAWHGISDLESYSKPRQPFTAILSLGTSRAAQGNLQTRVAEFIRSYMLPWVVITINIEEEMEKVYAFPTGSSTLKNCVNVWNYYLNDVHYVKDLEHYVSDEYWRHSRKGVGSRLQLGAPAVGDLGFQGTINLRKSYVLDSDGEQHPLYGDKQTIPDVIWGTATDRYTAWDTIDSFDGTYINAPLYKGEVNVDITTGEQNNPEYHLATSDDLEHGIHTGDIVYEDGDVIAKIISDTGFIYNNDPLSEPVEGDINIYGGRVTTVDVHNRAETITFTTNKPYVRDNVGLEEHDLIFSDVFIDPEKYTGIGDLGILGSNAYFIYNGMLFMKTPTDYEQVGEMDEWTDIGSAHAISEIYYTPGICGGHLYNVKEKEVSEFINGNGELDYSNPNKWTHVTGYVNEEFTAFAINNGHLFRLYLDEDNVYKYALIDGQHTWTFITGVYYQSTYTGYGIADGKLYKLTESIEEIKVTERISYEHGNVGVPNIKYDGTAIIYRTPSSISSLDGDKISNITYNANAEDERKLISFKFNNTTVTNDFSNVKTERGITTYTCSNGDFTLAFAYKDDYLQNIYVETIDYNAKITLKQDNVLEYKIEEKEEIIGWTGLISRYHHYNEDYYTYGICNGVLYYINHQTVGRIKNIYKSQNTPTCVCGYYNDISPRTFGYAIIDNRLYSLQKDQAVLRDSTKSWKKICGSAINTDTFIMGLTTDGYVYGINASKLLLLNPDNEWVDIFGRFGQMDERINTCYGYGLRTNSYGTKLVAFAKSGTKDVALENTLAGFWKEDGKGPKVQLSDYNITNMVLRLGRDHYVYGEDNIRLGFPHRHYYDDEPDVPSNYDIHVKYTTVGFENNSRYNLATKLTNWDYTYIYPDYKEGLDLSHTDGFNPKTGCFDTYTHCYIIPIGNQNINGKGEAYEFAQNQSYMDLPIETETHTEEDDQGYYDVTNDVPPNQVIIKFGYMYDVAYEEANPGLHPIILDKEGNTGLYYGKQNNVFGLYLKTSNEYKRIETLAEDHFSEKTITFNKNGNYYNVICGSFTHTSTGSNYVAYPYHLGGYNDNFGNAIIFLAQSSIKYLESQPLFTTGEYLGIDTGLNDTTIRINTKDNQEVRKVVEVRTNSGLIDELFQNKIYSTMDPTVLSGDLYATTDYNYNRFRTARQEGVTNTTLTFSGAYTLDPDVAIEKGDLIGRSQYNIHAIASRFNEINYLNLKPEYITGNPLYIHMDNISEYAPLLINRGDILNYSDGEVTIKGNAYDVIEFEGREIILLEVPAPIIIDDNVKLEEFYIMHPEEGKIWLKGVDYVFEDGQLELIPLSWEEDNPSTDGEKLKVLMQSYEIVEKELLKEIPYTIFTPQMLFATEEDKAYINKPLLQSEIIGTYTGSGSAKFVPSGDIFELDTEKQQTVSHELVFNAEKFELDVSKIITDEANFNSYTAILERVSDRTSIVFELGDAITTQDRPNVSIDAEPVLVIGANGNQPFAKLDDANDTQEQDEDMSTWWRVNGTGKRYVKFHVNKTSRGINTTRLTKSNNPSTEPKDQMQFRDGIAHRFNRFNYLDTINLNSWYGLSVTFTSSDDPMVDQGLFEFDNASVYLKDGILTFRNDGVDTPIQDLRTNPTSDIVLGVFNYGDKEEDPDEDPQDLSIYKRINLLQGLEKPEEEELTQHVIPMIEYPEMYHVEETPYTMDWESVQLLTNLEEREPEDPEQETIPIEPTPVEQEKKLLNTMRVYISAGGGEWTALTPYFFTRTCRIGYAQTDTDKLPWNGKIDLNKSYYYGANDVTEPLFNFSQTTSMLISSNGTSWSQVGSKTTPYTIDGIKLTNAFTGTIDCYESNLLLPYELGWLENKTFIEKVIKQQLRKKDPTFNEENHDVPFDIEAYGVQITREPARWDTITVTYDTVDYAVYVENGDYLLKLEVNQDKESGNVLLDAKGTPTWVNGLGSNFALGNYFTYDASSDEYFVVCAKPNSTELNALLGYNGTGTQGIYHDTKWKYFDGSNGYDLGIPVETDRYIYFKLYTQTNNIEYSYDGLEWIKLNRECSFAPYDDICIGIGCTPSGMGYFDGDIDFKKSYSKNTDIDIFYRKYNKITPLISEDGENWLPITLAPMLTLKDLIKFGQGFDGELDLYKSNLLLEDTVYWTANKINVFARIDYPEDHTYTDEFVYSVIRDEMPILESVGFSGDSETFEGMTVTDGNLTWNKLNIGLDYELSDEERLFVENNFIGITQYNKIATLHTLRGDYVVVDILLDDLERTRQIKLFDFINWTVTTIDNWKANSLFDLYQIISVDDKYYQISKIADTRYYQTNETIKVLPSELHTYIAGFPHVGNQVRLTYNDWYFLRKHHTPYDFKITYDDDFAYISIQEFNPNYDPNDDFNPEEPYYEQLLYKTDKKNIIVRIGYEFDGEVSVKDSYRGDEILCDYKEWHYYAIMYKKSGTDDWAIWKEFIINKDWNTYMSTGYDLLGKMFLLTSYVSTDTYSTKFVVYYDGEYITPIGAVEIDYPTGIAHEYSNNDYLLLRNKTMIRGNQVYVYVHTGDDISDQGVATGVSIVNGNFVESAYPTNILHRAVENRTFCIVYELNMDGTITFKFIGYYQVEHELTPESQHKLTIVPVKIIHTGEYIDVLGQQTEVLEYEYITQDMDLHIQYRIKQDAAEYDYYTEKATNELNWYDLDIIHGDVKYFEEEIKDVYYGQIETGYYIDYRGNATNIDRYGLEYHKGDIIEYRVWCGNIDTFDVVINHVVLDTDYTIKQRINIPYL